MKKAVTVISIICVLIIAGVILVLTGVIDLTAENQKQTEEKAASSYIEYTESYILLSDDGTALQLVSERPEGIPQISGINVKQMLIGEVLKVTDEENFNFALSVVRDLNENEISGIYEIYVNRENEIVMYVESIKIILGRQEKSGERIKKLADLYDQLLVYKGTLDISELSETNQDITLKIAD